MKVSLAKIGLAIVFFLSPIASAGTLKIGTTPGTSPEILALIKPTLEKQGVKLEIHEFSDYIQPNLAIADGSIDVNLFQHVPYLRSFQKDRPLGIVAGAPVLVAPLGIYSKRVPSLIELKIGATIAIPNDATNLARALKLLQAGGVIRLKEKLGLSATVRDITSNVKRIKIVELDAAQLPRSLSDVDAAIINTGYAIDAGLNPVKDSIFLENKRSEYVNVLAGKPEALKTTDYLKLVKAIQSSEVKNFILQRYKGAILPAF